MSSAASPSDSLPAALAARGPFELRIAALPGRSDKVVDPGDSLVARSDAILMTTGVEMLANLFDAMRAASGRRPLIGSAGPAEFLFQGGQRFGNVPDSEKENGAVATEPLHDGLRVRVRDFILGLAATSLALGFLAISSLELAEHPLYLGGRDTLAARRARQNILDDFRGRALGRKPVHRGRRQIRNRC
jgi:hypothetical protein